MAERRLTNRNSNATNSPRINHWSKFFRPVSKTDTGCRDSCALEAISVPDVASKEKFLPNGDLRMVVLGSGVFSFRKLHFFPKMHRFFDDEALSANTSSSGQPSSDETSFSLSLRENENFEPLLGLVPEECE